MYIFGYFFQKGHFKGSSKKRAHRQKFWGGSWGTKRVLGSKFLKSLMSMLKRQVNSSPNFASFFIIMTHNSFVSLSAYIFYFG